ncbi:MAG: hypothetical protein A2X12_05530 [Bacteroidetes bacterium GWE2_29_8]|nr:MAG: hypothetical protein A2X12_05530 [Bacteroidetes bacterium GWE2_29_8]
MNNLNIIEKLLISVIIIIILFPASANCVNATKYNKHIDISLYFYNLNENNQTYSSIDNNVTNIVDNINQRDDADLEFNKFYSKNTFFNKTFHVCYNVCKKTKRYKKIVIYKQSTTAQSSFGIKEYISKKDNLINLLSIKLNKNYIINIISFEKMFVIEKEYIPFNIKSLLDPFPD